MPSTTRKQAKFMSLVAKSPKFAKKVGVPQKVGKEFHRADVGVMMRMAKRFGRGR